MSLRSLTAVLAVSSAFTLIAPAMAEELSLDDAKGCLRGGTWGFDAGRTRQLLQLINKEGNFDVVEMEFGTLKLTCMDGGKATVEIDGASSAMRYELTDTNPRTGDRFQLWIISDSGAKLGLQIQYNGEREMYVTIRDETRAEADHPGVMVKK